MTTNNNKNNEKNNNNENILSQRDRERAKQVVNQYNIICKDLPKVKVINQRRFKAILNFLGEIEEHNKVDKELVFTSIFFLVKESLYLNGDNKNSWKANFDWIIKYWVKIYEGQYKDAI